VVNYGCRISDHESEQGVITVWADFLVAQIQSASGVFYQLPNGAVGQPYTPVVLTTGGKPPYIHTLTDADLPAGIVVTDAAAGVQVSGTAESAGTEFAFTVHCQDALGNKVDQTFTIQVTAAAQSAT
jgi:hypothetical protein